MTSRQQWYVLILINFVHYILVSVLPAFFLMHSVLPELIAYKLIDINVCAQLQMIPTCLFTLSLFTGIYFSHIVHLPTKMILGWHNAD